MSASRLPGAPLAAAQRSVDSTAGRRKGVGQGITLEVHGHQPRVRGYGAETALEQVALGRLCIGVVDLEDGQAVGAGDPVRAAVVPGP